MGKGDKKKQQEEEEEVISKKEAAKNKYPQVKGESRDFIVRILNKVEKSPRVRASFEKIIDTVKAKRDSRVYKDQDQAQLEALADQLSKFVGAESTTSASGFVSNPTEFNDCTNKFELLLD